VAPLAAKILEIELVLQALLSPADTPARPNLGDPDRSEFDRLATASSTSGCYSEIAVPWRPERNGRPASHETEICLLGHVVLGGPDTGAKHVLPVRFEARLPVHHMKLVLSER